MSWSKGLDPRLRPYAEYLVANIRGLKITSVRRTYSDQLRLWYNRHNNPYPVARPGTSMHERGRAWDMVGSKRTLRYAGAVWRSWGGRWDERDRIHFSA